MQVPLVNEQQSLVNRIPKQLPLDLQQEQCVECRFNWIRRQHPVRRFICQFRERDERRFGCLRHGMEVIQKVVKLANQL